MKLGAIFETAVCRRHYCWLRYVLIGVFLCVDRNFCVWLFDNKNAFAVDTEDLNPWKSACNCFSVQSSPIVVFEDSRTSATCPYNVSSIKVRWMWNIGGMILTGENRSREKPVFVPRYQPQISHGLLRDRTSTPATRGQRLTVCAMAQGTIWSVKLSNRYFSSHPNSTVIMCGQIIGS